MKTTQNRVIFTCPSCQRKFYDMQKADECQCGLDVGGEDGEIVDPGAALYELTQGPDPYEGVL